MGECTEVVGRLLNDRTYPKVVLLGKSLGCGVVAYLCQSNPQLADALAIYLTPPVGTAGFDPLFSETAQPSLLVIGGEDRFYEEGLIQRLEQQRDFEWLLLHDLTHSLDRPGSLKASLQAIEMVTQRITKFVSAD
jgi:dienelactone hydrolase